MGVIGHADNRTARLTGLMLLLVTLTHMAGFQISNSFMVSGNFAATSANVENGELSFRLAAFSYAASSILSVGLAVGFYLLIAPISKLGALLVLGWRLFEATLASVSWAIRFALIENHTNTNLLGTTGAEAIHRILRDVSNAAFDISAIGLALASIIGFALMYFAKTIPRVLSAIAMIGAIIVLVTSVVTLVLPDSDLPSHLAFALTLLSQLAISGWLIFAGVKVHGKPAGKQKSA